MVWTKNDSGKHPDGTMKTYGLGDLLRGTIYLYQMSGHSWTSHDASYAII
jgi:hypothetical protein